MYINLSKKIKKIKNNSKGKENFDYVLRAYNNYYGTERSTEKVGRETDLFEGCPIVDNNPGCTLDKTDRGLQDSRS